MLTLSVDWSREEMIESASLSVKGSSPSFVRISLKSALDMTKSSHVSNLANASAISSFIFSWDFRGTCCSMNSTMLARSILSVSGKND